MSKNTTKLPGGLAAGDDEAKRQADEKAAAEAEAKRQADEKAAAEAEAKRQADERAAAEAEAKRQADEKAAAEAEAKRIADEQAARVAAPLDAVSTVVLTVVALADRRRAGRAWPKGETQVTAAELQQLGPDGLQALLADGQLIVSSAHPSTRNLVAPRTGDAGAAAEPGGDHVLTVVSTVDNRRRAGRSWPRGATHLTAAEFAAIGAEGIAALKADRAFIVTER